MTLIRQLWLLLLGTVVVGVLGSALVTVAAARGYIETELRLKNSDNAQALALTISQQRGDLALAEIVIAAQFDTGFYERIRLLSPDGRVIIDRHASPQPGAAPAWFVRAVPIVSTPGVAQVSDGWRPLGTLEVVSAAGFAHADLWRGSLRSAGWLMCVGLLAGALGSLVLRRIRAPLRATVEQAQALVERRFVTVDEPQVPELRQLSRAMNAMVQRLRAVFAEQGAQLEALREQAQADPLTGLAHRGHFLAQLASLLGREDAPSGGALLLIRARDLSALNRELGHGATDAMLRALAQALRAASAGQAMAWAGRLNGSDFALLLGGVEPAVAAVAVSSTLREALSQWPPASVAVGAVAWSAGAVAGQLMQQADDALVRAEAKGEYGLVIEQATAGAASDLGETGWRRRLLGALERRDAQLGSYPVNDRAGQLLHLECPLRLRLEDGSAFEPAARWLPWAIRSQLTARADLCAVELALEQIAVDGRPRGVNFAPDSLADTGFLAQLRALLQARPQAARSVWLEVDERAAIERLASVRELGRQVRPFGVKLGLEHAGERLAQVDHLYETGLDFVKLDASLSFEIARDARRAEFLRGLASMLHGLGIQVHAEGVTAADDARALWACGIDGVTGPWVGEAMPHDVD